MSLATRRPLRMAGALAASGFTDTGEVNFTQGGQRTVTVWSGGLAPAMRGIPGGAASGNNITVFSGAGRLHKIMPHLQMQSGVQAWFYDSDLPARSGAGPVVSLLAESGARVLGIIPVTHRLGDIAGFQSGYGFSTPWQDVITVEAPFTSGLYVSAASGCPGFSFTYTPAAPAVSYLE